MTSEITEAERVGRDKWLKQIEAQKAKEREQEAESIKDVYRLHPDNGGEWWWLITSVFIAILLAEFNSGFAFGILIAGFVLSVVEHLHRRLVQIRDVLAKIYLANDRHK